MFSGLSLLLAGIAATEEAPKFFNLVLHNQGLDSATGGR
jgi:hypothetical protein